MRKHLANEAVARAGLAFAGKAEATVRPWGARLTAGTTSPSQSTNSTNAENASVQEVADGEAEALTATNETALRRLGKRSLYAIVIGAGVAIFAAATVCGDSTNCRQFDWSTWTPARRSVVVTTATVAALLLFLSLMRRSDRGLRSLLVGKDGRFSSGATQALMWTLALAYAVLFLTLQLPFGRAGSFASSFDELDVTYLLLLGGPFAAAGVSRVAIGRKVEAGEVQKTTATETKLSDVISDDDGNTDLVDTQFLIFNLVVLAYFIATFAANPNGLPKIPAGLVGLTSVAALTYAGTKASMQNAPLITSVAKLDASGAIRPGDQVVVLGANFVPPGADRVDLLLRVRVKFGEREMMVVTDLDDTKKVLRSDRIVVRVPEDVPAGSTSVSVITAAGVESDAYPLLIVADEPVITGLRPIPIERGKSLLITGRFFQRPGFTGEATVMFGDIPVLGQNSRSTRVEVVAPNVNLGSQVAISVRAFGGLTASEPVTLPVQTP
jgi:hypothetical protein